MMRHITDAEVYITPPGGSRFKTEAVLDLNYKRFLDSSQPSTCSISVPHDVPMTPNSHIIVVDGGEVVFRGWASDSWSIRKEERKVQNGLTRITGTREASCWGEEYALYYRPCPLYVYQINEHRIIHPWWSDTPNQTATGTASAYTMGLLWWANSGIQDRNWILHHSGSNCFKLDGYGTLTRISPTGDLYVDGKLYTHRSTVADVIANAYSWTQDGQYLYAAPLTYGPTCNVAQTNAFDTNLRLGAYTDSWNTTFDSPLKLGPHRRISDLLALLAKSYALYQVCRRTMDYTYVEPLDDPGRGSDV